MDMKTLILLAAVAILLVVACSEKKSASAGREGRGEPIAVQVLERWQAGNAINVALLVQEPEFFNKEAALQAVAENCGENCNMAYFYKNKAAYDLHAYSRTNFTNPDLRYGGNYQKMVKAQAAWKKKNGNWQKVGDGLIATVGFGEYEPFPYK